MAKGSKLHNLTGMVFGKLTPINRIEKDDDRRTYWECRCECGNICIKRADYLLNGRSTHCGCSRNKTAGSTCKPTELKLRNREFKQKGIYVYSSEETNLPLNDLYTFDNEGNPYPLSFD